MTPKEKAHELIEKYVSISIDDILNVVDKDINYQNVYAFYLEVKQEIEKLKNCYSEQDVLNAIHYSELKYNKDYSKIYYTMKEWFKQFKNK